MRTLNLAFVSDNHVFISVPGKRPDRGSSVTVNMQSLVSTKSTQPGIFKRHRVKRTMRKDTCNAMFHSYEISRFYVPIVGIIPAKNLRFHIKTCIPAIGDRLAKPEVKQTIRCCHDNAKPNQERSHSTLAVLIALRNA